MQQQRYDISIATTERRLVSIEDFRIAESAITVLFGESGIGKSMTALAIAGLLDPDELQVKINGATYDSYLRSPAAKDIRRNGFFVFQEPSSHLNPLLTVRAQLSEGDLANVPDEPKILARLWSGASPPGKEILDVYPKPYRPSGGEKQRILAAMAFKKMSAVSEGAPGALFIFDEPTGNLDNALRDEFLDLLVENFRRRAITVLLITHDYSMISRFTKTYPDIAKQILYKELSLENEQLRLKDFRPEEYLTWLQTRKKRGAGAAGEGVLATLEPVVNIFGRSLVISRDRAGRQPTPLILRKGSLSYIKAPSGTGKTTIVKSMMGLLKADAMTMKMKGVMFSRDTRRTVWQKKVWGRVMTLVFQHADEALNQNARVKDVFAGLPLSSRMDGQTVLRVLSELFEEKLDNEFLVRKVKFLSGGQKQRLNLLRSFVLETDILILDEPLNGLDFVSSVKVIEKIERKLQTGKSILVISHNEEIFDALGTPEDTYYLHAS